MSKGNIEDAANVVNSILLWRIYDLLLLDLMAKSPEMAAKVVRMHEQGQFVGPNPSFSKDEDDKDDVAPDQPRTGS